MTGTLRPATREDAPALWLWANDPVTRHASGDRAEIPWAAHLSWLADRLDRSDAELFMLEESVDHHPVGTIRFETTDDWSSARVSYDVAPASRGRGLGGELLRRGTAAIRQLHPGVTLVALVAADNEPSRHLFEKLGWAAERTTDGLRFTAEAPVPR
jgi:RimJ/RimL family protein N-acetyltransferase